MSHPPKTYRIYRFDASHMIVTADAIEAVDREEAVRLVEAMGYGSKCEIWDERELIAVLNRRSAA